MAQSIQLGQSVLGRPIECVQFEPPSYAQTRPPAIIFSAIHGDEPATQLMAERLIGELLERPPGRLTWVIPCLNPDGIAAGTKNNASDVDLNRSFAATNWQAAFKAGYFPGKTPESEPEVQALVSLIEQAQATRLIALHATFRCINWDGSGQPLATAMSQHSGYPCQADLGYPTPGSFGSKYGVDRNLEVITVEVPYLIPEEAAWLDLRSALRFAVDLPT